MLTEGYVEHKINPSERNKLTPKSKEDGKMETAIKEAVKAYAEMAQMSEIEVLQALKDGNEVITRSVQMLLFCVATV